MKLLTKISCVFLLLMFLAAMYSITTFAVKTQYFDSLTPNLQLVLRKYGEHQKRVWHDDNTPEEIANEGLLNGSVVEIDGSYCYIDSEEWYPSKPKLTNEDIDSLSKLTKMEEFTLKNFDLENVDVTKFLDIDNGGKIKFIFLDDCEFAQDDEEIGLLLHRDGYKIGTEPGIWIAWPGVDPDKIFNGR